MLDYFAACAATLSISAFLAASVASRPEINPRACTFSSFFTMSSDSSSRSESSEPAFASSPSPASAKSKFASEVSSGVATGVSPLIWLEIMQSICYANTYSYRA
jgi:hypothetical protein